MKIIQLKSLAYCGNEHPLHNTISLKQKNLMVRQKFIQDRCNITMLDEK